MTQEPTHDELMRAIKRDHRIKEMLASRIASLVTENAELLAFVQELQGDLQQLQAPASANGDNSPAEAPRANVEGREQPAVRHGDDPMGVLPGQ